MKVIVWLWNPWEKFERNRHNVWFLFLDSLINNMFHVKNNFEYKQELNASVLYLSEYDLMLVKPHTFMNSSWETVNAIKNAYNVNNEDILVIVDEIYLDFWIVRYRENWSDGWQNWMKSIISFIWNNFPRLRIWIGQDKSITLRDFVLSDFNENELNQLDNIFNKWISVLKERFFWKL